MNKSFHHFILGLSFLCGLLLTASLIETGDPLNADHVLFSTLIFPAFGQEPELIEITTDKFSYSEGETIIVSGQVSEILFGYPVSLMVKAPNDNLILIDQLMVGSDKKFSTELTAGGSLMKVDGEYTIQVLYGNENLTDEISFTYGGSASGGAFLIDVEGTDFMLNFSITGGVLVNIIPDPEVDSLIATIIATSDGEFIITLPRELIDAKTRGGHDSNFIVLVDGEEVDFVEERRSTDRTLQIAFPAGAQDIEFFGSELANTGSAQPSESEPEEVENKPPVIAYKYDKPVYVREQVTIDFSDSNDPDGTIESSKFQIESAVYHDITTFDATFESIGNKEITITLTDNDGSVVEENFTIQVFPAKPNGPDLTLIIIGIIVATVAGGVGLAIAKSRKSSTETITKTVPKSDRSGKGRECNVCGTIIPEEKNTCPNCGDTYS